MLNKAYPIYIILYFLCSFSFIPLCAQQYPQKLLTVDDGLPQSIVTSLMKDSFGFLWISTNEGVARFDGTKFVTYNQSTGHHFHLVNGIIEKEPGVIWVADHAFGLWKLEQGKSTKIIFDSSLTQYYINFLKKTEDGKVLLGVEPGGLYIFQNDSIINISAKNSVLAEPIITAAGDSKGGIWVGSYMDGAQRIVNRKIVQHLKLENGLPSNEVWAIQSRANGQVWFGTKKGLYVLNASYISDRFNERYPKMEISGLYKENEENIWMNTTNLQGGIFHFQNNEVVEVINENQSFYTKCTLIDESQTIFAGTYNGLLIMPCREFQNYDRTSGLNDIYIKAITGDSDGRLWIATKKDGLYYWQKDKFIHFPTFQLDQEIPSSVSLKFFDDEMWYGTRKGLIIFKEGHQVKNKITATVDSLEIRKIGFIRNRKYLITRKRLFCVEQNEIEEITFNLKNTLVSFWGLAKDNNGTIWIATNGQGLWTLQDTSWIPFNDPDVPKYFYGIRTDENNNLYFPSSQGAYQWDGEHLIKILDYSGSVWDIIPSVQSGIWFGTSKGLIQLNQGRMITYSRENGFCGTEFNMGSFFKESENILWFGSVSGAVQFKNKNKTHEIKSRLIITDFHTPDSLYQFPIPSYISLDPEQNNIKIEYAYINFLDPTYTKYRYYLEGFEGATLTTSEQTNAVYTNLAPGNYVFHLMVYSGLDESLKKKVSLAFSITRPWFVSWWAYVIYFVLSAFTIYLFGLWRIRLLRKRNILLEKGIEERTHDLLASNARLKMEIQDRHRAEDELEKEKDQLAVTLSSIADGVIRTDQSGLIILMNKTAENLTGHLFSEYSGRNINEIFKIVEEHTRQPINLNFDQLFQDTEQIIYTAPAVLLSQTLANQINILFNIVPIVNNLNKKTGFVLVFRDTSLEKQMEEEIVRTQKLESIGVLAGGIAHDFNNILSGILGNTQLAQLALKNKKDVKKYLDSVEDATQTATYLTKQLLTFSKGGQPVKEVFDLYDHLVKSVQFSLRGSNVRSTFFIANNLWKIHADPGQINQVINNLVINADQAMPNGGTLMLDAINVEVDAGEEDSSLKAGKYVKIIISDQGHGISEENLVKIFDPYFSTKKKGSGLGLATSYSIMEKHGGSIAVKSEPGEGTNFVIHLPAYTKTSQREDTEKQELKSGQGYILIMDDEEYIRDLVKDMVEVLGYDAETASDGEKALAAFERAQNTEHPFKAILIDLTVPGGMGGKETIQKLIEIDPDVRAIVASGYSTDSILANYGDFGFKGILQKPFRLEQVSEMLHKVINE